MKTTTRGFLKGLMASFLTPVAAKHAIAEPPLLKSPEVKLEDYYDKPVSFCCSGMATGDYKSLFNCSGYYIVSG